MDWTMGPANTWDKMADWLRALGGTLPTTPKAILVISAHWEESVVTVASHANPPLIYDYYGFPEHTYQIKYPAPGAPDVAQQVQKLLKGAGIACQQDAQRGFDHGVFIPFKLIYPNADIPIVQLSLNSNLDPADHIALGEALAPLREQDILIVGSGLSFHNMGLLQGGGCGGHSDQFDQWLGETCTLPATQRNKQLSQWKQAPSAVQSHPREEHLIPLMVVAGAAQEPAKVIFNDRVLGAVVSAYRFG
ncbi:MAG: dioxygenase [Proteobacteria bacterium]|nr:dioxygenase [Pseudomonadota bacterium]